jgi:trk system potassium uptake protein TrkA
MKVLIVGGGKTVYFLARSFVAKGHAVTVINRDADECVRLASRLNVIVVHGDGSDPAILEEAGAQGADAVLAATPNGEDNLAACQLAALQFGVPRTVALVNDPDNEEVFRKLGVKAFATTRMVASLIEQRAALDEITNLVPVGEGKVNITEVALPSDAPVVGKQLRQLEFPDGALIAVILRDGEAIVPRGGTEIRAGDRLVLVTLPENHGPVLRLVAGENC